jgi:hypothetical protein
MLIKILLKIWPALLPIALYIIWRLVIKKIIFKIKERSKIINGEKIIGEKSSEKNEINNSGNLKKIFNFSDKNFIITLYISLILMIACLIFLAF